MHDYDMLAQKSVQYDILLLSNGNLDFPINFRIASLPGLPEAAPLVAHQVLAHVARSSAPLVLDQEQVVLVPNHHMLRQARDGRVPAPVVVPWMGVRLHLQHPPQCCSLKGSQRFRECEIPRPIQPTSLMQQTRPELWCIIPVARRGLLSLPPHFGQMVTEVDLDAPISAFPLKGAHIAIFVFRISWIINANAFHAPVVVPA